jgi:hypothetical protein
MKQCSQCGTVCEDSSFKKQSRVCRTCTMENQREYRRKNGNSCTLSYEKTKTGFLMRLYRNMESRVTGVQSKKAYLYEGKFLLTREAFYSWAIDSPEFHIMFAAWEEAHYDRKLTPTVDRENSKLGYSLDNMRWLTHSENSRLGAISKHIKYGHNLQTVI